MSASIPGSSSSWCPAGTGCPSCLSCSLLRRRLASSLIKLAIHLMWCRSKHSAILAYVYPRHCYSILFSGFHSHRRIDELVVHELQSITMHPAPCLNHEWLQPRPILTSFARLCISTCSSGYRARMMRPRYVTRRRTGHSHVNDKFPPPADRSHLRDRFAPRKMAKIKWKLKNVEIKKWDSISSLKIQFLYLFHKPPL